MITVGNKGTGASRKRSKNVDDGRKSPPDKVRVNHFQCNVRTAKVGLTV